MPAAALALPGLPDDLDDLLPKADVERFEVTVRGNQSCSLNFGYDANPSVPCSLHGSSTLNEFWEYERGKT